MLKLGHHQFEVDVRTRDAELGSRQMSFAYSCRTGRMRGRGCMKGRGVLDLDKCLTSPDPAQKLLASTDVPRNVQQRLDAITLVSS